MTLAELIAAHLPEFVEAARGGTPHEEARKRFRALVAERTGSAPPEFSASAFRAALPHWLAAVRTLRPEWLVNEPPPKNWRGWTVTRGERGYLALARKRSGRRQAVYVGKHWSEEVARAKVEAKGYALEEEAA